MAHIPTTLVTIRPGDAFLIVSSDQYWGKGTTIAAARRALRVAGQRGSPAHWQVYSVDPKAFVNDFGDLVSKSGHKPILVAKY